MICLGLTGSIGMGKTTVAGMFGALGAAVWDADAAVHRLYAPGAKGAAVIALLVPAAVGADGVDRGQLRTAIMEDADLLARIEARIHPLVSQDRAQFANDMRARGTQVAVFDIPLLFETQAERTLDKTVVVSAPAEMQRARVMARPGMTEAIFSRILAKQMPDEEKRRRADYVIHTDGEKAQTMLQVQAVWADVIGECHA